MSRPREYRPPPGDVAERLAALAESFPALASQEGMGALRVELRPFDGAGLARLHALTASYIAFAKGTGAPLDNGALNLRGALVVVLAELHRLAPQPPGPARRGADAFGVEVLADLDAQHKAAVAAWIATL